MSKPNEKPDKDQKQRFIEAALTSNAMSPKRLLEIPSRTHYAIYNIATYKVVK